MRTLIDGLEEAFRSFGGVPQELLLDYVARHIIRILCPPVLCGRCTMIAGHVQAVHVSMAT